jgi:simple sugar transport system substrate-binding protein
MNKPTILLLNLLLLCVNVYLLSSVFFGNGEGNATDKYADADMDIVFFAGGSEHGIFAPIVARGALLAGEHLGVKVRIVWSQWDIVKMARQFKEELELRPDAICMMGHPGIDRLSSLVKEARRKEIVITMQNVDLPVLRESYISSGFGYVGQDLEKSGRLLAEGLISKYNLKAGDNAIVFQSYSAQSETRGKRGNGAFEALRQQGLIVESVNTPYEYAMDASTLDARAYIRKILRSSKNLSVIINDGIINNEPVIDELKAMGMAPGKIKYGAFDLSRSSVDHLKTGYIGLVHDQQPFLQGYYSVLQAYMAKKFHFSGLYLDTGLSLIDAAMLDHIEPLFDSGLR